jgi:hypothetical protein
VTTHTNSLPEHPDRLENGGASPAIESLATVDRDELHPIQIEALRGMSPTRKWELVVASIQMARDVRCAAIRAARPDWTETQVQAEVSRQILLASD